MTRNTILLLLVSLLLLPAGARGQTDLPDGHPETPDRAEESDAGGAEIFLGAFRAIRNYHQQSFQDSVLWEKALEGLIQELDDPYATVFTPDEFDRFQENNTGNYAGIGVTITQLNDQVTVTAVFRGTPADQAGIQVGDRIVEVNGTDATDWTVGQASDEIRGPAGSSVDVRVLREGVAEPMPFTIRRDNVHVPAVTAETVRDSVGYVLLDRVARNSAQEVDSALTLLEGSKGLILDLRRNPGGYLEEALNMADLFLTPDQVVASARSRLPGADGESREESWEAQVPARLTETPIVVLVDEYTASASEIVAGALQDHDRALVLGERTFGKGVVQTVMRIPGDWRIRLTTGSWYTPLGRSLHRPRDGQGRPVGSSENDSASTVVTDAGRELQAGGGIFPDLPITDDTLSTAEQEFMEAAGEAGVSLGVRIAELAFDEASRRSDEDTPPGAPLLDEAALEEFIDSLTADGVDVEAMDGPDVRAYLSWRIRAQIADRMNDGTRALEVRMERDRVLAEAVRLLEAVQSQTDLFAAAARRTSDDTPAESAETAANPDRAHDGDDPGSR